MCSLSVRPAAPACLRRRSRVLGSNLIVVPVMLPVSTSWIPGARGFASVRASNGSGRDGRRRLRAAVTVTATNSFDPGVRLLTKQVTGDASAFAPESFQVQMPCSADGEVLPGFPPSVAVTAVENTSVPTLVDALHRGRGRLRSGVGGDLRSAGGRPCTAGLPAEPARALAWWRRIQRDRRRGPGSRPDPGCWAASSCCLRRGSGVGHPAPPTELITGRRPWHIGRKTPGRATSPGRAGRCAQRCDSRRPAGRASAIVGRADRGCGPRSFLLPDALRSSAAGLDWAVEAPRGRSAELSAA